jgi:hypothetical protein
MPTIMAHPIEGHGLIPPRRAGQAPARLLKAST